MTGPMATPSADTAPPVVLLMARKPGFLSEEFAYVSPGQKDATIYLAPEALIVGHVNAAESEGFQRPWVELFRRQVQNGRAVWTSMGRATTWSDGQFRFSALYPGTYKVFTHEWMERDPLTFNSGGQRYGFPPVYFPGANNFAGGTAIQLREGVTFSADLSPQRRRYYPVDISVANAPEGGFGMGVEVLAGGQGGPGYSLGYNPRTHRIEGWLPDGAYTVELWSYGPPPGLSGSVQISVQGAAATGNTVTLVPDADVRVNVAEEFTSTQGPGEGVPPSPPSDHITVSLLPAGEFAQRRRGGVSHRQPDAAADEPLTITSIMPGPYWVSVYSGRGFAAAIKYGDTDLLRQPLVVPPGGLRDPIEVTLRDDGAQIEGFIVESASNPQGTSPVPNPFTAPHVYLIPLPDSAGQFMDAWAPGGKFSLQKIPPGDYQVLAFARPQQNVEYGNAAAMRKYESLGQEIRLVAGQTAHLQLHLIPEDEQ
ncbi:MAG TPA: hypothetical protein VJV74_11365 [Terriglobia bacterium]|nr:hypothetical protein [Terriglobia bacterium]